MYANDAIPVRSELLAKLAGANRLAVPWVLVQVLLCGWIAYGIDWQAVAGSPLFSIVAVSFIAGPQLMSTLRNLVVQKKNIRDLKEQTRFGEYDKHRLQDLVDQTLDRLGMSRPGPPVYITPDKTFNASMLHLGLGGFLRSLNGVYLNRQVLHRLTPAEVQDIIGHELGHYARYYLLNQRFQGLTILLGALAGLLVTQWIGMSTLITMVALSACGSAGWYISGWMLLRYGETIEYLCDDLGAQTNGVVVSINGLLKMGADSELQLAIHQQELLHRRYQNLDARDVIEAIQAAIPYGHTSPEDLARAVEDSLRRRSQERRTLTVTGFLSYAWQGDDEDELEDEMLIAQAVQQLPRLDWESLLDRRGHIALNEQQVERLVDLIEAHPDALLFRLPEEVGRTDGVHPSFRNRILYLWHNRDEIAAARDSDQSAAWRLGRSA